MLSRFLVSLFVFAVGFLLLKYSYQIYLFTGVIPSAEKIFGGGGTYTMFKLLGVIFVALSLLHLFGVLPLLLSPLGNLFAV